MACCGVKNGAKDGMSVAKSGARDDTSDARIGAYRPSTSDVRPAHRNNCRRSYRYDYWPAK